MSYQIERIPYGNDEAILRLRKLNSGVDTLNPVLGKQIWEFIRSLDPGAEYLEDSAPCVWGVDTPNTAPTGLPKTATQFLINPSILPDLYRWLSTLS